jgi:hypothetical protein
MLTNLLLLLLIVVIFDRKAKVTIEMRQGRRAGSFAGRPTPGDAYIERPTSKAAISLRQGR